MSDRKLQVNWPDGLKLRTQPEPTDMSYTGIKVPNGTIVDAIGEPHHYDQHFTFQLVRTPEGRKGWLTYRSGDTILLNPAKLVSFVGPSVEPEKGNRLQVNWSEGLRLRVQPEPGMASFTGVTVANGTVVTAIGEPSRHSEGYVFQRVRTPQGQVGWLTYSYDDTFYLVEVEEKKEEGEGATRPEAALWVTWPDGLKLREQPEPSLDSFTGIVVPYGAKVVPLGVSVDHPEGYEFRKVRLTDGQVGWLTSSYGDAVYMSSDLTADPVALAQVSPVSGLWAEMRGSPGGTVEWWVGGAVPLRVIDPESAGAKIGRTGQWIEIETPAFKRGLIGAQYLKPFAPGGHKRPARRGESPYIYGVHDAYDRKVLKAAGVTGWVLFTEAVGTDHRGRVATVTRIMNGSARVLGSCRDSITDTVLAAPSPNLTSTTTLPAPAPLTWNALLTQTILRVAATSGSLPMK